jgi:ribosome-binding factor A
LARKQGHNKVVFEEKMKNEINISFRRDIADPRLTMISVTKVELTADYSQAKIYWDTFDASKRGDAKKAVEGISSRLRNILAKKLDMRHTPSLTFIYDSQFEDEKNITKILNEETKSK